MQIEAFFDDATWTLTYLVWDPDTGDAVIIDPVLDFDPLAVSVSHRSVERVVQKAHEVGAKVHYALDTHAHADHLSGLEAVRQALGARTAIGKEVTGVQRAFKELLGLPDLPTDGSQFDLLVEDGVPIQAGSLTVEPLHCPGHTPACYAYRIRDALFTGDVLFMPDFGTGRCDFPGGSAAALYASIQRLYRLPEETRVFVGHDYQPGGRPLRFETTIGQSRRENIQIRADTPEEGFVRMRTERDRTLRPPRLIFQSLQVNVNAGRLPEPEPNGRRYLKLPMGVFDAP